MVKPLITKPSQNLGSIVNPKTNEDYNKVKPDPSSPTLKEDLKESNKPNLPNAKQPSLSKNKSTALNRNKLIL